MRPPANVQCTPRGTCACVCGAVCAAALCCAIPCAVLCRYALDATDAGHALSFTWPGAPHDAVTAPAAPAAAALRGRLDLNEQVYKLDARPLVDGCTCMACTKHTRCAALKYANGTGIRLFCRSGRALVLRHQQAQRAFYSRYANT